MAKELLKEAIADAKAVREVAMQNAKLALEEAFNSKIQSMLAAKLNEELDEAEELEEVYNEDEDNMGKGSYMEDEKEMEEGMEYEEDEFEIEPIDYTMGKGSGKGTNQLPNPPDEINLEEILASLEEEMKYSEDEDDQREEDLDEEIDFTLEEEDEELEEEINLDALMEELMEEETIDEGFMDKIRSVFGSVLGTFERENADSEILANAKARAKKGIVATQDEADEFLGELNKWMKENDIEAGYAQAARSLANEKYKLGKNFGKGASTGFAQAFEESTELKEAYSTIETLRTQLAEVNLLNAKLLYVNKLFKANNLTETQKLKVVETLDEATNVKEAKLVFNTLKESFESTGLKKNITEGLKGFASKATGTPAKKEVLTEQADETVARFQKLANIKL